MQNNSDNRRHLRHEVIDFCILQNKSSSNSIRAIIIDVGIGGVAVQTRESFVIDAPITVTIGSVDLGQLKFHGCVRHCQKQSKSDTFSIGIQFQPETNHEKAMVAQFINQAFLRTTLPASSA